MSYINIFLRKLKSREWLTWGFIFFAVFSFLEDSQAGSNAHHIAGYVQNEDLRRVAQATVELRDQEGALLMSKSTDDAGEFTFITPTTGVFSIRAIQETYRSEYEIIEVGKETLSPVVLTMTVTQEIALEVVAPLLPIQPKSSSETYSLSRTEIEALPFGSNIEFNDALFTIPSAVNGSLKQVHIRQEHANFQVRIDGVPIPDTITSAFADVISPRAWERADIILGGMEAQFGNRAAAVIDITSKSGTKPGFGSMQLFGGSNANVMPSFEYGGTAGDKFRYYVMNSYTTTNRGIDPPTLGDSGYQNQSERNQTFLRGDYQLNNTNNFTLLFLNSIAKFQIPTMPHQTQNSDIVALLPITPVASEDIDESQKEANQYAHLVWRHDVNANQFFSLAGYLRHSRATFKTDPYNVLAYTSDAEEPFSAGDQDRFSYAGGVRFDYTNVVNSQHLVKAGFQFDRTQAINKTRLSVFARDGNGDPTGSVLARNADNRIIGYREEFWVQDQYTPSDQWTLNLGIRVDNIHGYVEAMQISPRVGVTFKANNNHAFHAFYGRLFTPPNLEAIRFAQLNTVDTTAEPEDLTNNTIKPERSHYFEVGSTHAIGQVAVAQLTGYYKLNSNMSDAHQFGSTPLLNYFAFKRGWQRGIEGSLKIKLMDNLSARGNVAWGQCKGYGLQSGHFLLHEEELSDIDTSSGVFCDHMQEVTSSAVLTYRVFKDTTITGQMLFGSGLRTAATGQKTNSQSADSITTYNFSIAHVIPLPRKQKLLFGLDVINVFDQEEFINVGEATIGLGVSHTNMPRSFFFRAQWFFDS